MREHVSDPSVPAGGPEPDEFGLAAGSHRPGSAEVAILVAAVLIGLLRFLRLGEWSLWIDEALTVADYKNPQPGSLVNHVGYSLVGATAALFRPADDPFAIRFLPALVGWLEVPLAWLCLRRLVGGRAAALVALLLALSPWHLYWSQNARFYTLASTCTLVGGSLALHACFAPARDGSAASESARGALLRGLVGFAIAAVGVLFHPSAGFALPALALAPWFAWPRTGAPRPVARRVALALLVVLVLLGVAAVPRLRDAFAEYRLSKGQPSPAALLLTTGWYVHPVVAASALVGAWIAWTRRRPELLGVTAFVLLLGAQALLAACFARVVAQYVFVALPFVLALACLPLVAGSGGERATRAGSGGAVRCALLLALVASYASGSALYFTRLQGERPRWKEAFAWVAEHAQDGDAILSMAAPVGEYYLAPDSRNYRVPRRVGWIDSFRPQRLQDMAAARAACGSS